MPSRIAIVTDSTSYLPTEMAEAHHIVKVPVQVVVSGKCYREGIDISTEQVAAALREWAMVTTSRPSPQEFLAAYQAAADTGAEAIVSAHLSSELSGTYETALLAAQDSPIPVRVVDSRSIAMGLGFACLSGAEAAENGGDVDTVAATIEGRALRSKVFFYVDTLEYLRRGGRIGKAATMVGNVLRVKPILGMVDGRVDIIEKARTSTKALIRLADLAVASLGTSDVDLAVHHLDAADKADQLEALLMERIPGATIIRSEIGAVVGTHVGPGMAAVVVAPRTW